MKTAVYARVATDGQARSSLRGQVAECYQYAASNGLEVVRVFEEVFSGIRLDRPGLERLRGMVNRREIDAVIVYRLDRLSRSAEHMKTLCDELKEHGVALYIVKA